MGEAMVDSRSFEAPETVFSRNLGSRETVLSGGVRSHMLAGEPVMWDSDGFEPVEGVGWGWLVHEGTATRGGVDYRVSTSRALYSDEAFDVLMTVARQSGLIDDRVHDELFHESIMFGSPSGYSVAALDRVVDASPPFTPYGELTDAQRDMLGDRGGLYHRIVAARMGYGLDELVHDAEDYVRGVVAEQGYGLDALYSDGNASVREAVEWKLGSMGKTIDEWVLENPGRCALPEFSDMWRGQDLTDEGKAAIMRDVAANGGWIETSIGQDAVGYDAELGVVTHEALEGDGFTWVASDVFLASMYDAVANGDVRDVAEARKLVGESERRYRDGEFAYKPAKHEGEPVFDQDTDDYMEWALELARARGGLEAEADGGSEMAAGAYGFDDGGFSDGDDGMEDGGEGLPY